MSEATVPAEGQRAPDFKATATSGSIGLSDYVGKKPLVLYFYPKADTPGCTREACGFRDASSVFEGRGIAVVGASADTIDDQRAFAEKHNLHFPLIADPDRKVLDAYGVWGERTRPDGTKAIGVRRWTFLIDRDGTVRKVYQNVTPETHADEILNDAQALGVA